LSGYLSGVGHDLVRGDLTQGIYTITLESEHNRNALSRQLLSELADHLERADDPATRVIVLTHAGRAFCSGADLTERASAEADSAGDSAGDSGLSPFVGVLERLMHLEIPTIAALNGPARAGGIGLMAACDLVVVARSVDFALTEVRIGVAPAIIAVPILRRVAASAIAAAMLTGERFSADTAREWGLITHCTDDVDHAVADLCRGILAGAPSAVRATKSILRRVPTMGIDEAFVEMSRLSSALFASPDAGEGIAAFADKRPPRWHTEISP